MHLKKFRAHDKSKSHFMSAGEEGFTLVELLIYLTITAFLSLGISRLISDAAVGLDRASSESVAAREVIRFTNLIRFDFSSSSDVFVNPLDENLCPYTPTSGVIFSNLFTTKIRNIFPAQWNGTSASNSFDDFLSNSLVTYLLERKTSDNTTYLVRVSCKTSSGPSKFERLVNLGSIGSKTDPLPTGPTILKCGSPCTVANTTTANALFYELNLPYNGLRSTLRNVTASASLQLKTLTRKVDET